MPACCLVSALLSTESTSDFAGLSDIQSRSDVSRPIPFPMQSAFLYWFLTALLPFLSFNSSLYRLHFAVDLYTANAMYTIMFFFCWISVALWLLRVGYFSSEIDSRIIWYYSIAIFSLSLLTYSQRLCIQRTRRCINEFYYCYYYIIIINYFMRYVAMKRVKDQQLH